MAKIWKTEKSMHFIREVYQAMYKIKQKRISFCTTRNLDIEKPIGFLHILFAILAKSTSFRYFLKWVRRVRFRLDEMHVDSYFIR